MLTVVVLGVGPAHATPPRPAPEPPPARAVPTRSVSVVRTGEIEWDLRRNFAGGLRRPAGDGGRSIRIVPAVDVTELGERREADVARPTPDEEPRRSAFGVWSKRFDNGIASVVDERVLTDLRMVDGDDAGRLGPEGIEIGRVKLRDYDPVDLAEFLVGSGIVDANLHIEAHVTGWHGRSEDGHWFRLHSKDPYWTNKANLATYDFGLHVARDGTIRMVNVAHLGRVPVRDE